MKSIVFLYFLVFIISLAITLVCERIIIPTLKKRASQPIYEGGPSWHISKKGTPTMGGLAFPIALTICSLISLLYLVNLGKSIYAISIIISLIYSIANALVGVIDDVTKLRRKENAGLTPAQKLLFQTIFSVIFLMARNRFLGDDTIISLGALEIDLGILYYPLALVILVGIVNCANLTDGIDGLASSVALSIGIIFSILCFSIPDGALLSAALIGCSLGFLFFNKHPALIFMGDTGSLFLGSLVSSIAFAYGNPLILLPVGIVYVIEGVSVILQVLVFKLTKKRLFKMAPFHHHLEKNGYGENKICFIAVATTLILSAIVIILIGAIK